MPRPDDVFIATFPKSGTTLLQMLLYQLTTSGDMVFSHIYAVSPLLESALRWDDNLEQLASPRVFKTHLQYESLGHLTETGRWIYVIRHPGDVLISAHRHAEMQLGRRFEFNEFAANSYLSIPPWGTWRDHTASWWPHRDDPNVAFLRFEDLINVRQSTQAIAAFLGIPLALETLERTVSRCDPEFMQAHEAKFDPRLATRLRDPPRFLGRGSTDGWKRLAKPIRDRLGSDIAIALGGDHADFFGDLNP